MNQDRVRARREHPLFDAHRTEAGARRAAERPVTSETELDAVDHLVEAARDLIGAAHSVLDAFEAVLDEQADLRRDTPPRSASDASAFGGEVSPRAPRRGGGEVSPRGRGAPRVRRIDID